MRNACLRCRDVCSNGDGLLKKTAIVLILYRPACLSPSQGTHSSNWKEGQSISCPPEWFASYMYIQHEALFPVLGSLLGEPFIRASIQ